MERAIQTSDPDIASSYGGAEDPQVHKGPTPRGLMPQVTYKPARQQKESGGIRTIEFSVNGEEGIRLSDALEGNWVNFDSRDDGISFGDGRLQIMIRLQVRLAVITSTQAPQLNFSFRLSDAHPGNQR